MSKWDDFWCCDPLSPRWAQTLWVLAGVATVVTLGWAWGGWIGGAR